MLYQLLVLPIVVVLALVFPRRRRGVLGKVGRLFNCLGQRRTITILLVATVAFLIAAGMSLATHLPVPWVEDEFAYLLGADTFAHGRLTNPTHPMWEHFESYYIFHQPTYQMKYPPGQSILLAVGKKLGHPAVGVWLGLALAAGGTCWMLYGWVPPRWALFGGILVLLNFKLLRFWGQFYWGGSLAMVGGALLFGALPRLIQRPNVMSSVCMGVGIAVLANTRPYEGLVASLLVAFAMLVWLVSHRRPSLRIFSLKIAVPILAVLIPVAGWMALLNKQVTGDPWKLPYQNYAEIYGKKSLLGTMFRGVGSPGKSSRSIPLSLNEETRKRLATQTEEAFKNRTGKLFLHWSFYVGVLLTVPLLVLPISIRRVRVWYPLLCVVVVELAVILQNTRGHVHYAAPVGALIVLLVVQGLRTLVHVRFGAIRFGENLVYLMPIALLVCGLLGFRDFLRGPNVPPWAVHRARILQQFENNPDRHLVVVRYSSDHVPFDEWVYNSADIDAAKVIWARELTPEKNEKLINYFQERKVWLLEADAKPPRLILHSSP